MSQNLGELEPSRMRNYILSEEYRMKIEIGRAGWLVIEKLEKMIEKNKNKNKNKKKKKKKKSVLPNCSTDRLIGVWGRRSRRQTPTLSSRSRLLSRLPPHRAGANGEKKTKEREERKREKVRKQGRKQKTVPVQSRCDVTRIQ